MYISILGTMRVAAADAVSQIPSARQRAVLAALLITENRTVSISRLVDLVWGPHPVASASNLVHTYVWRLRALLAEDPRQPLITEPDGYRLAVRPDEVDALEFDRLAQAGRAALAAGDAAGAARRLRSALELWKGEPYAETALYGADFDAEVQRLHELRTAVHEQRIEADLALGQHQALIGELRSIVTQEPLRESLTGHLMLAYYRSGRQAEALAAFRKLRSVLRTELGVDPSPEVEELHRRILATDPGLLPVAGAAARPGRRFVPHQLLAAVETFVGREGESTVLDALLGAADHAARAPTGVIAGAAGVGKTALAVTWAHRYADRFPDGQLYVDLRGHAPGLEPMPPDAAIRAFLDAFDVPPERIPQTLDAQSALLRSVLSGKRVLLVLDNAKDTRQVRPLLPHNPTCLTLITSRRMLAGLVAAEGALAVALDLLSADECRTLLSMRLGAERLAGEPRATEDLIDLCARLPLALCIIAARALIEPTLPLSAMVEEMQQLHRRLDALDIGDATTDVRAVFSWSYHRLRPSAARMFRLQGIHPGPDITVAAAASLAAVSADEARRQLAELVQTQLIVHDAARDRFSFHDLLRAYAVERANLTDGPAERRAAVTRALDHSLHTAYAASRLMYPSRDPIVLGPAAPGVVPEQLTGEDDARTWVEAEQRSVLAAIRAAADHGLDTHGHQLPWTLATYLDQRGDWRTALAIQRFALAAAERLGNPTEQARANRALGLFHSRLTEYDAASRHLGRTLDLYRQLGDRANEAHTFHTLSWLFEQQGRYPQARDHAARALELFRAAEHRAGEGLALNALGWLSSLCGDHATALTHCQQALDLNRELGNESGAASAWDSLGYAHHHLARYTEAIECYQRALVIRQRSDQQYSQATTHDCLGDVYSTMNEQEQAALHWRRAVEILDELGHPRADAIRAKTAELSG